jgi:hypothetical protein
MRGLRTREGTAIASEDAPFEARWAWRGSAISGVVAAAVMGLAIWGMQIETLRIAISGLYGQAGNVMAGWIAHLGHGALFGIIFALVLTDPTLHKVGNHLWRTLFAGTIYSIVLAVVGAGIIMPIWMGAVGLTNVPSIPNVTVPSLLWHLMYGIALGALFPFMRNI